MVEKWKQHIFVADQPVYLNTALRRVAKTFRLIDLLRYYVYNSKLTDTFLQSSFSWIKPHFTTTLIVMSQERNVCFVFALQACLNATHVCASQPQVRSAERRGHKRGKGVVFTWRHYQSVAEMRFMSTYRSTRCQKKSNGQVTMQSTRCPEKRLTVAN